MIAEHRPPFGDFHCNFSRHIFSTRPKRSQLGTLSNELLLTSNSFDTVTPHHMMKTSITWSRSMTKLLFGETKRALACVTSVSVWFRRKERPRKGIFGFDSARNKRGGRGRGKGRKETSSPPLPALSHAPFFARSLTLAPRCLL